jgi:ADP-heptose:LPS heptosyltransferase
MPSEHPILILQMQRMGDLALTYPLCGWLASTRPGLPIWVVGERMFFEGMLDISPAVTFFDYSSSEVLRQRKFSLIINLSHRREAALLAGALSCDARLGPYIPPENEDGAMRIEGYWQLYRASITHNNRHNLFHWADLNALDILSLSHLRRTAWPTPKPAEKSSKNNRIGLFVGASEEDKRPDTNFWVSLAEKLLRFGTKPVLLGGKKDQAQANSVASRLNIHALNLCGHFSISELCLFMRKLDLLIVPDTGPMHIAAWVNLPVLNLSLGPVNAWETAPFAPNHHVIRPALSCSGCWLCDKAEILCKNKLSASLVAEIAKVILDASPQLLPKLNLQGHELYRTDRDEYGLFTMRRLNPHGGTACFRLRRSSFWKLFFLTALRKLPMDETTLPELRNLAQFLKYPDKMHGKLSAQGQRLLLALRHATLSNKYGDFSGESFWKSCPPILRPLSSYVHLTLHNDDFSRESIRNSIRLVEFFISLIQR